VVKNSLAGRAGAGTPHEAILKDLAGPNSIAYTNTDPVALAKALTKYAKDVRCSSLRLAMVKAAFFPSQESSSSRFFHQGKLISKIMFLRMRRRSVLLRSYRRFRATWLS